MEQNNSMNPGDRVLADDGRDPLGKFLSDPDSHLADILYLNFRAYKRQLIWRFFARAVEAWNLGENETLAIADIGASMGFDFSYALNRMTGGFKQSPRWGRTLVTLVEGDDKLIAAGSREWAGVGQATGISHRYVKAALVEPLPLPDASQHIVLCSEVVEHLEFPEALLAEIFRGLRPGGFLILTTDNSPNALQAIKRLPIRLAGKYAVKYARPSKASETLEHCEINGRSYPIYGHINLNPTRHWEKIARCVGFELAEFGTYESIRRGGGRKAPWALAAYFVGGFLVSLLPRRLGRFFGDSTALLLRKPFQPPRSPGLFP